MNPGARLLPVMFAAACHAQAAEPTPTTLDGRIFFTAAERRALEVKPKPPETLASTPSAPRVQRRFDGALWRDGRLVALWFEGHAADPASEPAIRLRNGIPATAISGRSQPLLPGQGWPPQDGGSP